MLTPITPNLFLFNDTCNVYVLRNGDRAVLFDFGSGAVLDELDQIGVAAVDMVFHTHHHRDQCQGDHLLVERGIPIVVPEREAGNFENADAFWRLKRIYHNYDVSGIGNTLARPVPIARRLRDYERADWRGHRFSVLPTPGHTKGSVTYLVEVDDKIVAICGDLIAAPGKLHTIHDLQWQYGMPDGVGAALHSVLLLASKSVDALLPSHGAPMDRPREALNGLAANLRTLYELQREMRANRVFPLWPHSVDQPKSHVLPHLWANTHSVSNMYALVGDDGNGLLLDYGFPSWDHFACDLRFVEHTLDELRDQAGLQRIEAVIPSHYHDDHLAGLPYLQQRFGTQAWIFENFAEIVVEPAGYNIPCLLPQPIKVDRTLKDGQAFDWNGFRFDVFHMPGHTWWALGMFGVIDGTRVAFTGDNLLAGTMSPLRAAAPVYRNKMLVDSMAVGVERLMEFQPELLLSGHTGVIQVDKQALEGFWTWARQMSDAFRTLVTVPAEVNFALDPNFATLFPYRSTARGGSNLQLELRVTNHAADAEIVRGTLSLPADWTASPASAEASVEPGAEGVLRFSVDVPSTAAGRHVVCAEVAVGDRRFGQACEAIVDIA
jgi:glyoxylase-like metal-dependent hydrolase (beta-lactamase superfamily II)